MGANEKRLSGQGKVLTEKRFDKLLEHSKEGIALLSCESNFLYAASSMQMLSGYSAKELIGSNFFNLVLPGDLSYVKKTMISVAANPSLAIQLNPIRIRHKNGSSRWIDGTLANELDDPIISGIVINIRDITEQKVAAEKIILTNRLHSFISQINKAVNQSSSRKTLLRKVCQIAIDVGKFTWATIDTKSDATKINSSIEFSATESNSCGKFVDIFLNNDLLNQVYQTGKATLLNSTSLNSLVENTGDIAHSENGTFVILPLKNSDHIIGTFNLYLSESIEFSANEIALLEEAASDLASALNILKDLKDKKNSVKALLKTKANLEAIVNSTSEGFILTDVDGVIMEFNANAQQSTHLFLNKQLAVGESFYDYMPTDRRNNYTEYFRQVLEGKTINFVHSTSNSWAIAIAPFYIQQEVVGYCLSFRDITEEKLAAEKLLESEIFNRSVLSSLSEQIAVIDKEGTVIAVNKAWDDFTAKSDNVVKNSAVGSNYFKVCRSAIDSGDLEVELTLKGILSIFNNKAKSFHMEYPCDSPTQKRWFILNVVPFGDDNTKVVISHQNITARKIAESNLHDTSIELTKSLAEYRKILDFSLDLICTINIDREFVMVSKACEQIIGYSPEELIGTNFINYVSELDREATSKTAEKIFNGSPFHYYENRCLHKNGKLVPMMWSINWDKEVGLLYCVGKDMSDKETFEIALQQERDQFYDMFLKAPSAVGLLKGKNHIYQMANPLYLKLVGQQNIVGKTVSEVIPEIVDQGFLSVLDHVYYTGQPYSDQEVLINININKDGMDIPTDYYISFLFQPYRGLNGNIEGVLFFMNDITEQVQSRKEIEKSEKRFKGIIENSSDMVTMMDLTGKIVYASPAVSKTFGYSPEELINMSFVDVIHPDDIEVTSNFIAEVLRRPSVPMQSPLIRERKKDGTYMWVEGILTNFLETEEIGSVVANFRDVTDRKTSETNLISTMIELEGERTRLVTAQKVSKTGSWETNLETFELTWSAEMHRIYGTNPETFKGTHAVFLSFVHPEDRAKVDDAFKKSLTKKHVSSSIEHKIVTVQGIQKYVQETWTISKNENDTFGAAIGTCQDITERKEAADKVKKSETKLKVAQQIAHVGSWEVDLSNNEHSWSDEFYRILGINKKIQPSSAAFYECIHPDDQIEAKVFMEAASVTTTNSSFTFRFIRKNGEIGYASSEWRFDYDSKEMPHYLYGILRDLTTEKTAEIERSKMISDIIQRNNDLEQFSYIVSHNLRAPVANIIGLTTELSDNSHTDDTKEILAEALRSDVKRLEGVIVDLNTILQTKREITQMKEPVILSKLVRDIKLSIKDLIQQDNISIKTNFTQIDKINTIKSYIQSIFYNLITNSIKYRRPNTDSHIEIRSHIDQNKLTLVFKDNGRGIDLVKKGDQVFGLYKRFHADTEGKGMGLYMVKTQVETLGGTISIISEVNIGTTFTIEFPF